MNTNSIKEFSRYLHKDIEAAYSELEKIDDRSRIHLQKLVYTNLVDRFDFMIDNFLLDNFNQPELIEEATKPLLRPITESDLIKLLINPNRDNLITEIIKDSLRNTLLRNRHSKKLSKLFSIVNKDIKVWNEPRVNISTGKVLDKIKPQLKTIPYSICGYADWLYSRRNAIVHGGGNSNILKNDSEQLEKLFKCKPSKKLTLQLSSIKISLEFYKCVLEIIK